MKKIITQHGIRNIAHQAQIKLDNGAVFDITTFELPARDFSNTDINFWVSDEIRATIPYDSDNPNQVMESVKEMLRQHNLANDTNKEFLSVYPSESMNLNLLTEGRGRIEVMIYLKAPIPE